MASKRKRNVPGKTLNSPYVTVGRNNIRRRKGGTRIADKDVRNNALLYLENLKDEEAQNYSQWAFQNKLDSAVSGALDPVVGPEAYMDLSGYQSDLPVAFGNTAAGRLMGVLLGTLDMSDEERIAEVQKACDEAKSDLEQKLQQEQENRQKVEYTLGLFQELIPVDNKPGGGGPS